MKRFLLIASYPDSLIKFRGPLLDCLLKKGLTVHVAVPRLSSESSIFQHLVAKGVHVHRIPLDRTGMNPLMDLITLCSLCAIMLRVRPYCVMSYTIKPVIYGSLAASLTRVPRVFALITGLGYVFNGNEKDVRRGLLCSLVQRLYRFSLSGCYKVFFQNRDDEALFFDQHVLSHHSSSFVVNGSGVDLVEYAVAPISEKTSFLLIARLLGDKGVREYVAAAKKVCAKYPHVVFKLVGWIDSNPDAISQEELDVWIAEGTIEYLGKMDDVRPAIASASVYVLPSYREGTPRTVLEAMAMGRAVITTDAPGCRETVMNGYNGFLVPVKAVDELVEAIEKFIVKPGLIKEMGLCSRKIAESKYDVHKVNDVMLTEMGLGHDETYI